MNCATYSYISIDSRKLFHAVDEEVFRFALPPHPYYQSKLLSSAILFKLSSRLDNYLGRVLAHDLSLSPGSIPTRLELLSIRVNSCELR